MQFPRLCLWWRDDLCLAVAPELIQRIDFFNTVEIEPDHHRCGIAVRLSKATTGEKDPAMSSRNAGDPAACFAAPIEREAKVFDVVCGSLVDIMDRQLRDCTRKFIVHASTPQDTSIPGYCARSDGI